MKLFAEDKNRGISLNLFAELCGISKQQFLNVFVSQKEDLSEYVQLRVNKGYAEWKKGRVRVMKRQDQTRFVEYRKEEKPVFLPKMGLQVSGGEIKLRIGLQNRHDYQNPTLEEQLRG